MLLPFLSPQGQSRHFRPAKGTSATVLAALTVDIEFVGEVPIAHCLMVPTERPITLCSCALRTSQGTTSAMRGRQKRHGRRVQQIQRGTWSGAVEGNAAAIWLPNSAALAGGATGGSVSRVPPI
jgi:hypothetical protein